MREPVEDRPGGASRTTALDVVRLEDREAFITADGSSIRELAGLPSGNADRQSLAEATVPPGGETAEHFHRTTEEIYTFTAGAGGEGGWRWRGRRGCGGGGSG